MAGQISLSTAKQNYKKGEMIEIMVKGKDLKSVNAISFGLPYLSQDYEFVSVQALAVKDMDNLTNDRLHTSGEKVLYPTFVHVGDQKALYGNEDLFVLKLRAKRDINYTLKAIQGFLVDKNLNTIKF
ncbi:hypothetical protein D3C87_1696970 [compost metagenome]